MGINLCLLILHLLHNKVFLQLTHFITFYLENPNFTI